MGLRHYRKSGTYFNFDFIYDELPHRLDSFDYEDLFQAREEMEIGTTNCLTGGADYFSFQEAKKSKDFRIFLRSLYASCSVPCLCRPICIHKVPYLDGGIASPIPYARALEQGYSQQVVILTQPLRHLHRTRVRSLPPRWIYRNAYPCIAALCKHYDEIYNQAAADLLKNASHGHVVLIAPETDFVVHLAERNRSKLVRLYFHGFKKGKSLAKEIRSRKV
jgi:predicted patatin/cPLA2 family phospholipase